MQKYMEMSDGRKRNSLLKSSIEYGSLNILVKLQKDKSG